MYIFFQMAITLLGHKCFLTMWIQLLNKQNCVCVCHTHMHLEASWKCYWDTKGDIRWESLGTVLRLVGLNTSVSSYLRSFSLGILALEPQKTPTSADKAWSSLHSSTREQLKDNLKMSTQIYTRPTTECWALHFSGARTRWKCYSIRWMQAAKLRHISPSGMRGPRKRGVGQPQSNLKETEPCTAISPPSQQEASNKDPFLWVVFFSPTLH